MRLFVQKYWPVLVLLGVELVIVAVNYKPGTFLMGWDNVMPEFNFPQALITNIFGVWQEHRGVGLPDGMGHAANLVHTLLLWLLSFALPQHALRYAFHFLMHFLGMAGTYTLLSRLIYPKRRIMPLAGALFYGFNLITIQMFYTPLEAFSAHFAALPWLTYSLILYLQQPYRNTLLLFISISFFTTPQFFIPTLLLPTAILLGTIGVIGLIQKKALIQPVLTAGAVFLCVNAFWLLPYLYNLPYNAPIIRNAKINQMSSNEVYERNRALGDVKNVLSMNGFMLDFEDVNAQGQPVFVMDAWRTWIHQPFVSPILFFFAFLMVFGIATTIVKHHTIVVNKPAIAETLTTIPFVLIWGSAFLFLANNTPGISDVLNIIRDRFPTFAEAYRFPFTKFSLLFAFSGTILLMHGLSFKRGRLAKLVFVALLGIAAFPVFQGQFFYDALRVTLPSDYISLFTFMNKKDHTGRTAYLPQPSFWSWKHYRFGYVGSGFLWYGIPQPLMDRAFDPWSNVNENYYWELTRAIYSKDTQALQAVFAKYDIRYIIVDGFLSAPSHDRSLFLEETHAILTALPDTNAIGTMGTITVYERPASTESHIRFTDTLPSVFPSAAWMDADIAYQTLGDYQITRTFDPSKSAVFPFQSLFTKRSVNEREFIMEQNNGQITLSSHTTGLQTPISTTPPQSSTQIIGLLPSLAIKPCGVLKSGTVQAESITDPRGNPAIRITSRNQRACASFGNTTIPHSQGYIVRVSSRHVEGRPLQLSIINNTAKHIELETFLPETDAWAESLFILPPLAPDGTGYTIYLTNDGIGAAQSVNEIGATTISPFPVDTLLTVSMGNPREKAVRIPIERSAVKYHNPSWYSVTVPRGASTLILSQAFNPLWAAYDVTGRPVWQKVIPFVFGEQISTHEMVNNWENGWQISENEREIAIIFLPQILEYAGAAVFVVGCALATFKNIKT